MLDVLNIICEKIKEILIASIEEIKEIFTGDFVDDWCIMKNVSDEVVKNVVDVYGENCVFSWENFSGLCNQFDIIIKISDNTKTYEKNIIVKMD